MHVRANQINPYAQLDSMYAAQKAARRRAAEQTRRKLLEFASALAGEADSEASVVKLKERDSPHEQTAQQNQQKTANRKKQEEPADPTGCSTPEDANHSISDWG